MHNSCWAPDGEVVTRVVEQFGHSVTVYASRRHCLVERALVSVVQRRLPPKAQRTSGNDIHRDVKLHRLEPFFWLGHCWMQPFPRLRLHHRRAQFPALAVPDKRRIWTFLNAYTDLLRLDGMTIDEVPTESLDP